MGAGEPEPRPDARRLVDDDARYFLHQAASTPGLSAVRGARGIWVEEIGGRRFMDFHGNSVHHLGYSHPTLIAALKAQLDDLTFSPRRFTNEVAVALARRLAELAPAPLGKVLLAPSGNDAMEIALRLARVATGRFKTVSFWDAYHGAGLAASGSAASGGTAQERTVRCWPAPSTSPAHVLPVLRLRARRAAAARRVPADVRPFRALRAGEGRRRGRGRRQAPLERLRAAAGLLDGGAGGMRRPRRAPHSTVPNGLGKTGRFFAFERDAVPDIVVLGRRWRRYPPAGRRDPAGPGRAGTSPSATTRTRRTRLARGLTTLDILAQEGLVERAAQVGAWALDRLRALGRRHPSVGDVRGLGLRMAVELVEDRATKTPAREAARTVAKLAFERGLSFTVSGDSVLVLSPPLVISEAELDQAFAILDACLGEVEAGLSV
jgi:4-aminobutyrate aminotransferase